MATFTLNLLVAARMGVSVNFINGGLIKFGGDRNAHPYNLLNLPFFFISGCLCGIVGAGFVFFNGKVNKLRKRLLTSDASKVVEKTLIALLTSTVVYFLPLLTPTCYRKVAFGDEEHTRQYRCENSGEFNGLASLFFNTEGTIIKIFMQRTDFIHPPTLVIFTLFWYIFTILTYGTAVPAGLFLPGILIGCGFGHLTG